MFSIETFVLIGVTITNAVVLYLGVRQGGASRRRMRRVQRDLQELRRSDRAVTFGEPNIHIDPAVQGEEAGRRLRQLMAPPTLPALPPIPPIPSIPPIPPLPTISLRSLDSSEDLNTTILQNALDALSALSAMTTRVPVPGTWVSTQTTVEVSAPSPAPAPEPEPEGPKKTWHEHLTEE